MAHKYNARKTTIDGIEFASRKEASRYQELKAMEKDGMITDLILQPRFLLQEGFRDLAGIWRRPIYYQADFQYVESKTGRRIVEEVKGYETETWKMKQKMFLYKYEKLYLNVIK